MKRFIFLLMLMGFCFISEAQLDLPPSGANQKSVVAQYMGSHAYVKVVYNSPDVTSPRGDDRKGKIWGQLVPYGLNNLNFGISSDTNPSPWRAGANENTVIHFSHDVFVEGQPLAAGKYGFHIIPKETGSWTLIFSNNSSAWGSYFYQPEDDALRVEINPQDSEYHEWLTYEFTDRQEDNCTLALNWESKSLPFKVELVNSKDLYVSHLRKKMQDAPGFNWATRNQAANYCLQNSVNLEEAYEWQKATVSGAFIGNENITTLQTLAGLQLALKMENEALSTFEKAYKHKSANIFQVHQIGRQLINLDQKDFALNVFKYNLDTNGDQWPVNVGLARGYSALGEYETALTYAKKAHERAPDKLNKDGLARDIVKLQKRQDIN